MIAVPPEPRDGFKFVVFAENQPPYSPLPANYDGLHVETKWRLTPEELAEVVRTGYVYISVLKTPDIPLQPIFGAITRVDQY